MPPVSIQSSSPLQHPTSNLVFNLFLYILFHHPISSIMKFTAPILLLASLFTYASAEAASADADTDISRTHSRDFTPEALSENHLTARGAPKIPKGGDDKYMHVWIRTDKRPKTYTSSTYSSYAGLGQLMKDTGGQHKDVVVGNSKGYTEYGMGFDGDSWKKKDNADGAKVCDYSGKWDEVKDGQEKYEYKGQVKNMKETTKSIEKMGKWNENSSTLMRCTNAKCVAKAVTKGKVYNHKTYNCGTFADDMVKKLI
jgi:hypothetical protein